MAESHNYAYLDDPSDTDQIGIAVSGGGVRAACLGLGVLQMAEEEGFLERARYVSAVSGGSYIAAAFLASRAIDDPASSRATKPWTRGSAEEAHLKRHLRYLMEDWGDGIVVLARYVLGLLVNLLPYVASVVLVGAGSGVVLKQLGWLEELDLHSGHVLLSRDDRVRWLAGLALVLVAALVETIRERPRGWRVARRLLAALAVLPFLPDLVQLVAQSGNVSTFGRGWLISGGVLVLTLVLVMRTQWGVVGGPLRALLRAALRGLLALSFAAVIVVPFAYAVAGAVRSDGTHSWWVMALSGGLLLTFALFVHANTTSLSSLYSGRLARAYLVRASERTPDGGRGRSLYLDDVPIPALTTGGPELVICAAVNLRERDSAQGEGCASFVFTPTMVGSPALEPPGYVSAEAFSDHRLFRSHARLSVLIGASGAAIAPNMGRFTRKSGRLALAVLNFRLGIWLQTPTRWFGNGQAPEPSPRGILGGWWQTLRDGWFEPGPMATLQEALGSLSVHSRAVFISDGGHWDNSAVVELLRRRCSHILALDAANDADRLGNILRTVTLARSELGVEFDTDRSLLETGDPVLKLRYRYPDDGPTTPARYLVLLRTFLRDDMPADLLALAGAPGPFPRHSTVNQFFSSREFDAYVAMGRWLCARGIGAFDLPPPPSSAPEPVPAPAASDALSGVGKTKQTAGRARRPSRTTFSQ